ncbi:hypothetical protein Plim_2785 [Planctopirus limnophila DSM 3776]|uniref:ParD-like antitoxin of type II toxin-antitoxin system n=1 Tax=Planctopirus limnophila (strain ATCC 43296 / DSM 3776 / IFAM 1008 / Mu 290) TaxID=521674 RepID=D5SRB5_PLAL2|nr:hypothetical protein [Planctopirus limnophila]ADG68608.1 hypothetical protein Plim_2785 [Planctopirus limnophila DSM 3776]
MGQPVTLSDELVDDARAVAPGSQRSIAEQIEFWAELGKSIEPWLTGNGAPQGRSETVAQTLSNRVSEVSSPLGRQRVSETLAQRPYPHYEPVKDSPELLRQVLADGNRIVGKFDGREFIPIKADH